MNPRVLTATALIALGFVLFWPSGSSKKVERLYKDGEQLYSTENYEESIAKFEEALLNSLRSSKTLLATIKEKAALDEDMEKSITAVIEEVIKDFI